MANRLPNRTTQTVGYKFVGMPEPAQKNKTRRQDPLTPKTHLKVSSRAARRRPPVFCCCCCCCCRSLSLRRTPRLASSPSSATTRRSASPRRPWGSSPTRRTTWAARWPSTKPGSPSSGSGMYVFNHSNQIKRSILQRRESLVYLELVCLVCKNPTPVKSRMVYPVVKDSLISSQGRFNLKDSLISSQGWFDL